VLHVVFKINKKAKICRIYRIQFLRLRGGPCLGSNHQPSAYSNGHSTRAVVPFFWYGIVLEL
jgi:hypothetical protein